MVLHEPDRLRRRLIVAHRLVCLRPPALELFETQFIDDELHAGFMAILAVAQGIEHLDDGFDGGNQFVHRREFPQYLSDTRSRP